MAKKILIVEDEPDILSLAIIRLRTSGYEILTARDGEEALEVIKTGAAPDLILLDMLLPKIRGDVVCRKLKSDPRTKHIPVIIFTASVVRITEKIMDIGADDYVLKPFEPEDLLGKIRGLIG